MELLAQGEGVGTVELRSLKGLNLCSERDRKALEGAPWGGATLHDRPPLGCGPCREQTRGAGVAAGRPARGLLQAPRGRRPWRLGPGWRGEGGGKRPSSGCVLKVDLLEFADGRAMGERKQRSVGTTVRLLARAAVMMESHS